VEFSAPEGKHDKEVCIRNSTMRVQQESTQERPVLGRQVKSTYGLENDFVDGRLNYQYFLNP
jgi:hypothetical protein